MSQSWNLETATRSDFLFSGVLEHVGRRHGHGGSETCDPQKRASSSSKPEHPKTPLISCKPPKVKIPVQRWDTDIYYRRPAPLEAAQCPPP